jgi:hypothetical protein
MKAASNKPRIVMVGTPCDWRYEFRHPDRPVTADEVWEGERLISLARHLPESIPEQFARQQKKTLTEIESEGWSTPLAVCPDCGQPVLRGVPHEEHLRKWLEGGE